MTAGVVNPACIPFEFVRTAHSVRKHRCECRSAIIRWWKLKPLVWIPCIGYLHSCGSQNAMQAHPIAPFIHDA